MVKKFVSIIFVLALLAALFAWPISARAEAPRADLPQLIVGGSFTLEQGEVLDEDLTILGGNVTLESGSEVEGNIQLLGGRLEINGSVEGDIVAAGGYISLGEEAVVKGDVIMAGAFMDRAPGAEITGEITTADENPFNQVRFDRLWAPMGWWMQSVWNVLWFIFLAFALAALAVLLMMFFAPHTERVARVLVAQPAVAGGLGFLTLFVAPFVLVLLVITICLIPVALVSVLLLGLMITFGWIALGLEVGSRLAATLNQSWSAPIAAGVGTFAIVLLAGMLNSIPCIGWVFTLIPSSLALGSVLLTRFGTQEYPAFGEPVGVVNPPDPDAPVAGGASSDQAEIQS
jgi:hypothetical protein